MIRSSCARGRRARRSRSTRPPGGASRPAACAASSASRAAGAPSCSCTASRELVPLPEGDPAARRAGAAGGGLRLPGPRASPSGPTDFDYSWSGLARWTGEAIDALGHRPLPPGRPRHRRADRLRVGGAQPGAGALADRAQHDARLGRPSAGRGRCTRSRSAGSGRSGSRAAPAADVRQLFYLQGIADRAAMPRARDLRPLRAAEARRRRPGVPADHARLRADRGEAAVLWEGLAERPYPARIVWGERDPALGPDQLDVSSRRRSRCRDPILLPAKHFLQEDQAPAVAQAIADLAAPLG